MVDATKDQGTSRSGVSRVARNLLVGDLSDTADLADPAYAFEVRNDGAASITVVWMSAGSASGWVSEKVAAGTVRPFATAARRFAITGSDLPSTLATTVGVLLHLS